ncbi:MFS transporter [Paenibacillus sp. UNC499MF]|uniref:MFS transporter n=1 Tax=Paenibacillus sp. UNC499MF TaxID=1502751 RepID=UPI0008A0051C|nr:MFS transporter [Paenibacillus sp. UNC499MF]SEG23811.1 MFS transporter, DHA2 family, metal-tetracycline-proton antiporter [Paenibacillus sp. UNC499MF]
MAAITEQTPQTTPSFHAKRAVPVILLFFVFALIVDNSFKLVSVAIAEDLGISAAAVSWQASLAGLVIGIGAVIYASLADTISIRKLLSAGIILICIGSVIGFIFQHSYLLVIIARLIQTAGLAAAETLYVIYVTKHLPKEEQKKFLGLSTSSYSLSLVIGSITGGYVSTYLNWSTLFLIPLLSLILLPFILKYLPKEQSRKSHVDFIGLLLISAITTSVMMYLTDFNWIFIVIFIAAAALFLGYISKSKKSFIGISFFQNKRFAAVLAIAFVIYSVQLGYIFIFPFLLQKMYNLQLDTISLLLIPGYVTAILVGSLSGKIAKVLTNKQAVSIAMIIIVCSLALPGLIGGSVLVYVLSMLLFSGSFAFMYAPMLDSCIRSIPVERSGTAIGFYNLVLNVAVSIGITYTASLMDAVSFGTVLWILAAITLFALLMYGLLVGRLTESK